MKEMNVLWGTDSSSSNNMHRHNVERWLAVSDHVPSCTLPSPAPTPPVQRSLAVSWHVTSPGRPTSDDNSGLALLTNAAADTTQPSV